MSPSRSTNRRRWPAVAAGAAVIALIAAAAPATGAPTFPSFEEYGFQGEGEARIRDIDARQGRIAPTAAQQATAERLGALSVTWNPYGTPHVMVNHEGYLSAPREGSAVDVARAFVRDNAALFRLSAAEVDALEVVRDSPMYEAPDLRRVYQEGKPALNNDVPSSVLFRQRFGGLPAAVDGLLTLGVQSDGRIASVSSSITGDADLDGSQQVGPAEAIRTAAQDVDMDLGELAEVEVPDSRFLTFSASNVPDVQRARAVALPTPENGVRRAWEVTLLDSSIDEHGNPNSFISFIDAQTGRLWHRTNKVEHLAQGAGPSTVVSAAGVNARTALPATQTPSGGQFSGATKPGACGDGHEFTVAAGNGQITVAAAATTPPEVSDDDIVIRLQFDGVTVAEADVLGSPEVLAYNPQGGVPAGVYTVLICPFGGAAAPVIPYQGTFVATAGASAGGENGNVQLPTWRVFPANPPFVSGLDPADEDSIDTRVLWCWDNGRDPEDCAEEQRNSASRLPWDVLAPSTPTFTTDGNNASTAISEVSFLTPDTAANRPVSPTREYDFAWKNAWFEGSCDPTQFGPADSFVTGGPNDEAAAVTNLFVQHNRMHDWSYYLGFTEVNYNLQQSNFGNTGPERENDPELGSSQAGRRTINGRDNANQITLQDGVAPITNQYLWQPLAGAFYAPCVDGAYDQAVVAHEYGHAITNRMVGGPDGGTGATQGQTESWSDLQFAAYFTEFQISAGEGVNPYVLGPYVTGDVDSGIRNYAMNNSPLNYSDLDYDGNGLGSPHANGEIWSATNFDILRSLNAKYDAAFPSTDKALQFACAKGQKASSDCPGNRRWNQIQYDSYLLQPTGVSMVDSRDAMLAADRLRFKGANQKELWDAFAKRGLGASATTTGPTDVEAVAGWDSPLRSDEATITFAQPSGVTEMEVFVGKFEARATPVADTVADTEIGTTEEFVPGTYEFIARAKGFGAQRFTQTFAPGETRTVNVPLRRNFASVHKGAGITGDGVNLERLIDDTEETNFASLTGEGTASEGKGEGAQVEGRQVTVDLVGDAPVSVKEVQVSAVLRGPSMPDEDEDLPSDPDPGNQSRFSALRSFDILACNAAAGADCEDAASFTKIFGSADDAFPSVRPRPTVPDLMLRPFKVTETMATHLRLVVRDNQCTGAPDFQGEANPDSDPAFNPDCDTQAGSPDRAVLKPPTQLVRASEFQVFSDLSVPSNNPGPPAAAPATPAKAPAAAPAPAPAPGGGTPPPATAGGMLPATGVSNWVGVTALLLLTLGGYGAFRVRRNSLVD